MVQTINPILTGNMTSNMSGVSGKGGGSGDFDAYLQSILSRDNSMLETGISSGISDDSEIEITYQDDKLENSYDKEARERGAADNVKEQAADAGKGKTGNEISGELQNPMANNKKETDRDIPLKKKEEKKVVMQIAVSPKFFALKEKAGEANPKGIGKKGLLSAFKGKNKGEKAGLKLTLKELSLEMKNNVKKMVSDFRRKSISPEQLKDRMLSLLQNENLVQPLKAGSLKQKGAVKISGLSESKTSPSGNALKSLSLKDLGGNDKKEEPRSISDETVKIKENQAAKNLLNASDAKKVTGKAAKPLKKEGVKEENGELLDLKTGEDKKLDILGAGKKDIGAGSAAKEQGSSVQKALTDNKQRVLDQVARNTKVIVANKETTFSTMLRPESLGRVDMKFFMKDGKLSGKIILQNQEAADFFRANVEDIRAVFSKSDVEMGNIDVLVAGKESGMGGNNEHFQSSGNSDGQEAGQSGPAVSKEYAAVQDVFEENSINGSGTYLSGGDSRINVVI